MAGPHPARIKTGTPSFAGWTITRTCAGSWSIRVLAEEFANLQERAGVGQPSLFSH